MAYSAPLLTVWRVVTSLIIAVFVANAMRHGRMILKGNPISRSKEPMRFWIVVAGLGLIAGLPLLIGALHTVEG